YRVYLSICKKNENVAASQEIGYTFGLFPIAGIDKLHSGIKTAATYRKEFQPSSFLSKPKVMIALFVVVGDTNEQAGTYAEALDFWLLGKDNFNYLKAFPSVETARKHVYSEEEKAIMQANRIRMVVGNIKNVSAQ